MPKIRPSSDLRNHYNEISDLCHKTKEPVFITKNGRDDLVVMDADAFEEYKLPSFNTKEELLALLQEGLDDELAGRTHTIDEVFGDLLLEHSA